MGCLPWFRSRRRKQNTNAPASPDSDNDALPVRRFNTTTTDDEKLSPISPAYLGSEKEKIPIPASATRRWDSRNPSGRRSQSPSDDDDADGAAYKSKDEAVDDPEEERRKKKAEAARRKAEAEEQERLDFFQMM